MSITLDNEAVNVFKSYDEMAIACSKDIEDHKTLLKAIEAMIAQKQRQLQDIKDKTVDLVKASLDVIPSLDIPVNQQAENLNYAGIDEGALVSEKEIESEEAVEEPSQAIIPPIQVQKPRPANRRKTAGKGKVKRADKSKKPAVQSNNFTQDKYTDNITELRCLHHPESPVMDVGRQLCSSCKWKLINNGLKNYDKEPEVISYLRGETTAAPDMGQAMCPIHQSVPSYNQKTGLCKACQKKAKELGVENRHLTEKELKAIR
jgi:hypothetical protein